MNLQKYDKALSLLAGLYIVSLAFTDVWVLPWLGRKVQLPEFLFLLLLFSVMWRWRGIPRNLFRFWKLDLGLSLFLPAFALVAILSPGKYAYLEVLGLGYLWLLYWIFSRYLSQEDGRAVLFFDAILGLAGLLAGISVFSYWYTYLGLSQEGYWAEWKLIPYLGSVIRIKGLAISPNLWATTIEFCILILIGALLFMDRKHSFFFLLLLSVAALLLTFSKSIVAFVAVLGMLLPQRLPLKRSWKTIAVVVGLGMVFFYVFASHILILSEKDDNYRALKERPYLARQRLLKVAGFEFMKTTNVVLKKQALQAFWSSGGLGVGGGQFIEFVKIQQEKGAYPAYLPVYEPHSTYFGLLAEAGILGLLALAYAWASVGKAVRRISTFHLSNMDRALFWGAKAYLLLLMIEAVVVDILNFRTLWVALGIIGAIYIKYERRENLDG